MYQFWWLVTQDNITWCGGGRVLTKNYYTYCITHELYMYKFWWLVTPDQKNWRGGYWVKLEFNLFDFIYSYLINYMCNNFGALVTSDKKTCNLWLGEGGGGGGGGWTKNYCIYCIPHELPMYHFLVTSHTYKKILEILGIIQPCIRFAPFSKLNPKKTCQ